MPQTLLITVKAHALPVGSGTRFYILQEHAGSRGRCAMVQHGLHGMLIPKHSCLPVGSGTRVRAPGAP